ncbi:zinc finger protein 346 [Cephus cinctus]|uniref:Zinc finger protein 346 n=1 Tax=Cephus cinctus TaxID=211228 RepID=A0AAJ7CG97_CEPCN|nr:zinc finger protein 346 [Cephus cinctus]
MAASKAIENPEVPGLECLLPPPPPPPPPPTSPQGSRVEDKISISTTDASSTNLAIRDNSAISAISSSRTATALHTTTAGTVQSGAFPSVRSTSSYFPHPVVAGQSPAPEVTPWWIAEVDSDVYDASQYGQWYDASYNATTANSTTTASSSGSTASVSASQSSGKNKNKYYKRKSEFIDPAQDAEKVANAQRELSALMKPLKCDLCNAVMNSSLQAKLHYDGKPHQKKVSMFLNQSVKKLKSEDGQVSSTTGNEWNTYCDICKTWFTSQTDATQHYAGKKHVRAANGGPRVRTPKKFSNQNQYSQVDSTGRFGIGVAFQNEPQIVPVVTAAAESAPSPVVITAPRSTTSLYTPSPYPTPLRCDLCGVSANRQDQLETHKRGARHLRMLKLNGLPLPEPVQDNESMPTAPGPIDYSIYRTPSGQYYCAPCNLSLNSESSFAQHVESKKHKNQLNPKLASSLVAAGTITSPSLSASKKTRFKKK